MPKKLHILILIACLMFSSGVLKAEAPIDQTNPLYGRAVNPLRRANERVEALRALLEENGLKAMEDIFMQILTNSSEHMMIKRFIIEALSAAPEDSKVTLAEIIHDREMDLNTRRLALYKMWENETLGFHDMERMISDPHEDPSLVAEVLGLLRQPPSSAATDARLLLIKLAMSPTADAMIRTQALSSLSDDLENPDTLHVFFQIAADVRADKRLRELALLNLDTTDDGKVTDLNWSIVADERNPGPLRKFVLNFMTDDFLSMHKTELERIKEKATDLKLKEEIRGRLSRLKK